MENLLLSQASRLENRSHKARSCNTNIEFTKLVVLTIRKDDSLHCVKKPACALDLGSLEVLVLPNFG